MASGEDRGKAPEVPRPVLRGGSSRAGGRGRGQRGGQQRGGRATAAFQPIPPQESGLPQPPQRTAPEVPDLGEGDLSVEDLYDANEDFGLNDEELEIPFGMREMEQFLDEDEAREQNHPRGSSSRSTGFEVQVQDEQGNVSTRRLDVAGLNSMDRTLRVVVPWNEATDQPIDNGGHLFNRFLNDLGSNWMRFPLHFRTWRHVPKGPKDLAWEEAVQLRFAVRANRKRYTLVKMGDGWRNRRNRLFHSVDKDGTMPLEQLIESVPDGVPPNDWASFVQFRRSAEGQERKAQQENRQTDYGELYAITHRHRDGTPTSQQAEAAIERMQQSQAELRETQAEESQGSVDPTAPLKAGLGQAEHPGRVRGMGIGARPSMVYGRSAASEAGSSRGVRRPRDESVEQLRSDLERTQAAVAQQQQQMQQLHLQQMQQHADLIHAQQTQWRDITNNLLERGWSRLFPGEQYPEVPAPPRFVVQPPPPSPPTAADDGAVNSAQRPDPAAPEGAPPEGAPDDQPPAT